MGNDAGPMLLNRTRAARTLGMSARSFDRHRSAGRLGPRPVRIGATAYFRAEELRAWIQAGCPPQGQWTWGEGEQ